MGNANGRIVAAEKRGEGAVHKGFGFCIKCRSCFIENEDVGILDECTSNSNTLLLAARELGTSRTYVRIESVGLKQSVSGVREAGGERSLGKELTKSLMNWQLAFRAAAIISVLEASGFP